jgi:hypothetical protein
MRFSPFLFLLLISTACQESRIDTQQVRQKLNNRTLFHITDVQLIEGANRLGARVILQADSAQKRAMVQDQDSLTCIATLAPLVVALAKEEIKAERIAYANWHPKKDLPKVDEVLEAIHYTHSQGQTVPANLQKDGQSGFQYTAGLVVSTKACLSCHATWKVGEEVGIWHLRFGSRPAVKEASKGMKGMK